MKVIGIKKKYGPSFEANCIRGFVVISAGQVGPGGSASTDVKNACLQESSSPGLYKCPLNDVIVFESGVEPKLSSISQDSHEVLLVNFLFSFLKLSYDSASKFTVRSSLICVRLRLFDRNHSPLCFFSYNIKTPGLRKEPTVILSTL